MQKKFLKSVATLCAAFFASTGTAHAAEVVGTTGLEADVSTPLAITDVQITGASGTIPVKLLVTHGTLSMSTTTGLTFTGPTSGDELYFSGTVANVNAALATLTYTRASTGADELEVSLVEPGEVFFPDNGHLYEYIAVPGGITWTAAQTAAAALERYGATGYLATITSAEENAFAADRLEGAGWMGASDGGSEGVWRWVTGPETGTQFWTGTSTGSAFGGAYENWNTGEPNDAGGNEDCGQFLSGASGEWNDLPCTVTTLPGYVVEFGATGDMPDTAGNSFTITTYDFPEVTAFSPLDGATRIQTNADLVITFDADVDVGTGNVNIYRQNGSLLEAIDVTSGQVTGGGTDEITISPTYLRKGTQYYVTIDATAFDAVAGGSYVGIDDSTTWNFQTIPSSDVNTIYSGSLEVMSAEKACGEEQVDVALRAITQGAVRIMLTEDPSYEGGVWQSMSSETMDFSWTSPTEASSVTVYALFEGADGKRISGQASAVVKMHACEEEEDEDAGEGDVTTYRLIKGTSFSAVYLLEEGKRKPFPSEQVFFTHFSSFDDVEVLTDAELAAIPIGSPVLPKEGSLIKIQSLAPVYLVSLTSAGYVITHIPNEAAAAEQFGENWAGLVMDVEPTLFRYFIEQ